MSPKEQEIAIGELEERVDRLRTLYEQYFLGFEKLEPAVARKDVDRRFAILRKEQIRNTAQRFKFNVVTQKYNTYGMYWQRICRQIEEGTYKRHVQRAKRIFGGDRDMRDYAIDVELGDFDEDIDMDALLAEADAAVEAYKNDSPDTVPPPAPSQRSAQLRTGTPGTSFAVAGRRESLDEFEPNERESQPGLLRAARPAPLPAGAKPLVLRKVAREGAVNTEPPPSTNPAPRVVVPQPPISQPRVALPVPPPSAGRLPVANPPMRAPAPSSPSVGRMPVANPPMRAPAPSSPSVGRMPVANPPMPTQSSGRIPIANPSQPGMRPPAGSSPSIGRIAVPPPPASGRLPAAPPSKPNAAPPPSGPADSEPKPSTRPSMKPPPPLPSQLAKPKKKE